VLLADDFDGADGLGEDEEVGGAGGALVVEGPGVQGQAQDDGFEDEADGHVEGRVHVEALLGEAGGGVGGEGEAGGGDEAHAEEAGDGCGACGCGGLAVAGAGAEGGDAVAEGEGEQGEQGGPCLHGHLLDRVLHWESMGGSDSVSCVRSTVPLASVR
jgi:hypothetical protein